MDPVIRQLLDGLHHRDSGIKDDAIIHIALIIELNRFSPRNEESFRELLPLHLCKVKLDEETEKHMVDELVRCFERTQNPTIVWAIGKATPTVAAPPLLELLHQAREPFDEETVHQLLIALENCLAEYHSGMAAPVVASKLHDNDSSGIISRMSEGVSPRVSEVALRIMTIIADE